MTVIEGASVNATDRGVVGDGITNNTEAIQRAIDETAGLGATLHFPPGVFVSGTIHLRSNSSIHLEKGAVLKGDTSADSYPFIPPVLGSRMDTQPWRAFIYAANATNITIEGDGAIEPGGQYDVFQGIRGNSPLRPYGIHLVSCKNVVVRDVTMRNSAFWMQRYFNCEDLRISRITVYNHCNLNNDGLDIDGCRRVFVDNCRIDASDDALCLKSEGAPICEDVVVTNCVLSTSASAIKLGTGSVGGFRRVTISNCVIRPCLAEKMYHDSGLPGGLMGIDLGNVDGGILQDIVVSNVVMDGPETPIFMKLGKRNSRADNADSVWEDAPPITEGRTDTVTLANITARNAGPIASVIHGYPGNPIRNVTLSNISLAHSRPGTEEHCSLDVEEHAALYPFNRIFNTALPAFGFYVRHAVGLTMNDIRLQAHENEVRSACVFDDVERLRVRNMTIDAPPVDCPSVQLVNCRDVGTGTELH